MGGDALARGGSGGAGLSDPGHAWGSPETDQIGPLVEIINDMVARTTGRELALEVGDLYLLWKEDGLRVSLRALSGHPKATLPRSTLMWPCSAR